MEPQDPPFFEGAEKKLELVVDPALPPLRERGEEYWRGIARSCGADVISRISGSSGDAYLLSESSLFVFDHKIVMITCGCTQLTLALEELSREVPPSQLRFLVYERKNEVYPQRQPTSFFDDVRELSSRLPGRAFQFGDEDEHHLYLYHLDRPYPGESDDATVEVLMYGIDPEVVARFHDPAIDSEQLRRATGLDGILPGYRIDDHRFDPYGYSLNAIRGERYWTVHVTPDPLRSYASFEANHRRGETPERAVRRVLDAFRPRSFDVVTFDHGEPAVDVASPYELRSHVERDLSCGYRTRFLSFHRSDLGRRAPLELPLDVALPGSRTS
jgi:S-adenosylmethionine decarboxylase